VTDNCRAARVVPAYDPERLARAIADLVCDPDGAEALGERGRAFVVGAFSWSRAAADYERIYTGLARADRRERAGLGAVE
jgi:D-inositol-3-phosphate glycosyltransferase